MLIRCLFFDHILNWMDFLSRVCFILMCILFAISSIFQDRLSDRAFCLFATMEVILLIIVIATGTASGNTYFSTG
jgi:hypothetical protein